MKAFFEKLLDRPNPNTSLRVLGKAFLQASQGNREFTNTDESLEYIGRTVAEFITGRRKPHDQKPLDPTLLVLKADIQLATAVEILTIQQKSCFTLSGAVRMYNDQREIEREPFVISEAGVPNNAENSIIESFMHCIQSDFCLPAKNNTEATTIKYNLRASELLIRMKSILENNPRFIEEFLHLFANPGKFGEVKIQIKLKQCIEFAAHYLTQHFQQPAQGNNNNAPPKPTNDEILRYRTMRFFEKNHITNSEKFEQKTSRPNMRFKVFNSEQKATAENLVSYLAHHGFNAKLQTTQESKRPLVTLFTFDDSQPKIPKSLNS